MKKVLLCTSLLLLLPGCNRPQPPAAQTPAAPPLVSVTRWSERTELFMEYPAFIAGSKGRAAVHFTDIRTFKPVSRGRVTIELKQNGQVVQTFGTDGPSSPGIFGVDVEPQRPGNYSLAVSLHSPNLDDSHELGEVTVYAKQEEVSAASAAPKEETIPFLKEQQWTLDFATELAPEREMRESLRVAGEVRPRSGGEVEIAAPISGRIAASTSLPIVGTLVLEGQPLASLIPPTPAPADLPSLELALAEATTELDLARADRARAERLVEVGAVPGLRLQRAQAAEAQAGARLKAAQDRLSQYKATREADSVPSSESLFLVRAPIAGVVTNVLATNGKSVGQGEALLHIVAVDRVYVVASVPEAEAYRITQLTGAEMELPGAARTIPVRRLVSVSRWIDPNSRTLSVIYEVDNSERQLAIGQALPVRLFLSQVSKALAVPEGAVVDDGGRPVVFVQVAGESFARRPVRLGARASGYVQVREGLHPGERIVTKGAYLIRLAALSPQIPAHGHAH
ncbi:MAG: efflux RND transporter periplasmic adaptor subunit [Acidobacteria bacterium]|nr:efflux RND transporter periplasmic adaptor subunit [Acidobacteriota bacterium]